MLVFVNGHLGLLNSHLQKIASLASALFISVKVCCGVEFVVDNLMINV